MSIDPKANYYDAGGIEAMTVIKAKLTEEQFQGYLLGNAIKYNLRLNFKGTPLRDAEKADFYSSLLVENIAEQQNRIDEKENYIADRIISTDCYNFT